MTIKKPKKTTIRHLKKNASARDDFRNQHSMLHTPHPIKRGATSSHPPSGSTGPSADLVPHSRGHSPTARRKRLNLPSRYGHKTMIGRLLYVCNYYKPFVDLVGAEAGGIALVVVRGPKVKLVTPPLPRLALPLRFQTPAGIHTYGRKKNQER